MGQNGLEGVHALVIDEVSFTLQRLERTLQDIGIPNVHAAPNALAACSMMENGEVRPDLIVADFQMPDMNGVELLKRVRTVGVSDIRPDVFFCYPDGFPGTRRNRPGTATGSGRTSEQTADGRQRREEARRFIHHQTGT